MVQLPAQASVGSSLNKENFTAGKQGEAGDWSVAEPQTRTSLSSVAVQPLPSLIRTRPVMEEEPLQL